MANRAPQSSLTAAAGPAWLWRAGSQPGPCRRPLLLLPLILLLPILLLLCCSGPAVAPAPALDQGRPGVPDRPARAGGARADMGRPLRGLRPGDSGHTLRIPAGVSRANAGAGLKRKRGVFTTCATASAQSRAEPRAQAQTTSILRPAKWSIFAMPRFAVRPETVAALSSAAQTPFCLISSFALIAPPQSRAGPRSRAQTTAADFADFRRASR